jgi:uncharacterized hydrophobic protein (TIGR00271 family)
MLNLLIYNIKSHFSLKEDKASYDEIDNTLRSAINMKGSNLWVLVMAILIASVGLNVNSTAVIIGAMLISPLMGPIMGIGYGIGIYDFALIRNALVNLGFAVAISLVTATLYFLLTPLSEAQSELLARTSPTIWDVLIAFFGGLAGIIASTRKVKTNVIPGVAIATALMPPLCTAAYGLATGQWHVFFGAGYLFLINCVFIALATIIIISGSHLPHKKFVDTATEKKIKTYLGILVMVTVLPSLYLAYNLVRHEIFIQETKHILHNEFQMSDTHLFDTTIDPKSRKIEISLIGAYVEESVLKKIKAKLNEDLGNDISLIVHQTKDQTVDTISLKSSIIADLYKESQSELESKSKQIDDLNTKLNALETEQHNMKNILEEIHALNPDIIDLTLGNGLSWSSNGGVSDQHLIVLLVKSNKTISIEQQKQLETWLKTRLKTNQLRIVFEALQEISN